MMENERIDLSEYNLSSITKNIDDDSLHDIISRNNKNGICLRDVKFACCSDENNFYENQNVIGD